MSQRGLGFFLAAALIAAPVSAQIAGGDGLRDPLTPFVQPPPPPRTLWTPSALRVALMDQPVTPGALPQGFGVQRVETRVPTPDERAAGMAYRVDVLLSGPYRAQSISYRIYDTPEAAQLAVHDKTLGDRSVTLTRESLDANLTRAFSTGVAYPCARVHSASFADVVFMRCHYGVKGMPVIAGASVALPERGVTNAQGEIDMAALQNEMQPAGALLLVGLGQIQLLMTGDPDGTRAYARDIMRTSPAQPTPATQSSKKKKH